MKLYCEIANQKAQVLKLVFPAREALFYVIMT